MYEVCAPDTGQKLPWILLWIIIPITHAQKHSYTPGNVYPSFYACCQKKNVHSLTWHTVKVPLPLRIEHPCINHHRSVQESIVFLYKYCAQVSSYIGTCLCCWLQTLLLYQNYGTLYQQLTPTSQCQPLSLKWNSSSVIILFHTMIPSIHALSTTCGPAATVLCHVLQTFISS